MLIIDLETSGLLPECDKIWCCVAYDTVTDKMYSFLPYQGMSSLNYNLITDLPKFLDQYSAISCHNYVGFDKKVLKKVLNYEHKGRYVDTLMLSRVLFPDIDSEQYIDESGNEKTENKRHSVNAWALRFGMHKPEHEDWSQFSLEMLHRCKEDVKIQAKIYEYCMQHMKNLCETDPRVKNKWKDIFDLEQNVWELVEEQAEYGWEFDLQKAFKYCDELSQVCTQTEDRLVKALPQRVIQVTKTESGATKAFKTDGTWTSAAWNWLLDTAPVNSSNRQLSGDFCKVRFEQFNIRSSQQVKGYLLSKGWEPTEYNFKKDRFNKPIRDELTKQLIRTSPKVPKTSEEWAEISDMCNNPDIALLAEYSKASHRLSQVKGLINVTRSDHRIESRANTCGSNTARMLHSQIVNIPKSDPNVYYGQQMRSLFRAGEGKTLVGVDASALEARCEAHYIYPFDRIQSELLVAGDIHGINADVFQCSRSTAKTLKYAITYGCGPGKVASILKVSNKDAKLLLAEYWRVNSACKEFMDQLVAEYNQFGYVLAIDGRPLSIRYQHALLNTVLQSCGSICVKKAVILVNNHIKKGGWDAHMLTVQHDEIQFECPDIIVPSDEDGVLTQIHYADIIGKMGMHAMRMAGKHFNLNVALDGEYHIGKNWSLTH